MSEGMGSPAARPDAQAQLASFVFAYLLVDPDLQIADANPIAEAMIGRSAQRIIGCAIGDLLELSDNDLEARLANADAQIVAHGLPVLLRHRRFHVNLAIAPVPGHVGWRMMTLSEFGRDDFAPADNAEPALQTPAILAHEIKNPLSAIRGAGQLLARKLAPSDRALTGIIATEVDRIARLIDRMQQLGATNRDPLGPVNLHQSIRNAVATIRTGRDGGPEIVEAFDPSLPPVRANRDAFEQVLINLLSNAVEATQAVEHPRVFVRTRFAAGLTARTAEPGRTIALPVEITIADNGPGLDPALAVHIFDPFVSSKKNGQGLGLALVKKLVSDMDGRVSVSRDQDTQMTEFRINLALAEKEG